jgi:hypothetical protein
MLLGFILISKFERIPHVKHAIESASHGWDETKLRDYIYTAVVRGPGNTAVSVPPSTIAAVGRGPNRLKCTHCGKLGHTVQKCFDLHGYPTKKKKKKETSSVKRPSKNEPKSEGSSSTIKADVSTISFDSSKDRVDSSVRPLPVLSKPAVYKLLVDGHPLNCLYDTGAQVSVVREDVLRLLVAPEHSCLSSSPFTLCAADGRQMFSSGQVILSVEINARQLPGVFHVVDECPYDLILGPTFYRRLRSQTR